MVVKRYLARRDRLAVFRDFVGLVFRCRHVVMHFNNYLARSLISRRVHNTDLNTVAQNLVVGIVMRLGTLKLIAVGKRPRRPAVGRAYACRIQHHKNAVLRQNRFSFDALHRAVFNGNGVPAEDYRAVLSVQRHIDHPCPLVAMRRMDAAPRIRQSAFIRNEIGRVRTRLVIRILGGRRNIRIVGVVRIRAVRILRYLRIGIFRRNFGLGGPAFACHDKFGRVAVTVAVGQRVSKGVRDTRALGNVFPELVGVGAVRVDG